MFFLIGPKRDDRFTETHELNPYFWLNIDPGWTCVRLGRTIQVFYKGYCLDHAWSTELCNDLASDPTPRYSGSFTAVISYSDGRVAITHDVLRSYPLYWDGDKLGNISVTGDRIPAHVYVVLSHKFVENRFLIDLNAGPLRSMDDAVEHVYQHLCQSVNWLRQSDLPIKMFFTGGIDTLTCLALLRHLGIPHEVIPYEHFDYDHFTTNFVGDLRFQEQYWGYTQIHHWRDPCILVTGGMGDEMFLRGPAAANMVALSLGDGSIDGQLSPDDYHWHYFQRSSNTAIYRQQEKDHKLLQQLGNRRYLTARIINDVANDHQHWHLGNTLTFTPFKDLELLRTVLGMSAADQMAQIRDAQLQKLLVQRLAPDLLPLLQKYKNQGIRSVWYMDQLLKRQDHA